jgi:SSS family solute:Na+ symporter
MPEFLEKRFNKKCRTWLAIVSLLAYVLTKIAVALYAGAIIFDVILEVENKWVSAVLIVVLTAVYTFIGGLRAVVYTEAIQTIILVVGAVSLLIMGMWRVGGLGGLRHNFDLPDSYFHMFHPASDRSFPWTGILVGYPVIAFWYWCTDQVIVQRVLAAKSIPHARGATIFAGYLKLLPIFLLVFPGIIARALYPNEVKENPNKAYLFLLIRLMPRGLLGLVVASMLSALMSSFGSIFNSCSTIFTMDIYKKLRPSASENELVLTGRVATLVVMCLGLFWIPVVPHLSDELYIYLQSVQGYMSPPIAAVFLVGVLWKRANSTGAMACLVIGTCLGLSRLGLELILKNTKLDDEGSYSLLFYLLHLFVKSNFMHFTGFLFAVCMVILITVSWGVSWASPPPPLSHQQRQIICWAENDDNDQIQFTSTTSAINTSTLSSFFSSWWGRTARYQTFTDNQSYHDPIQNMEIAVHPENSPDNDDVHDNNNEKGSLRSTTQLLEEDKEEEEVAVEGLGRMMVSQKRFTMKLRLIWDWLFKKRSWTSPLLVLSGLLVVCVLCVEATFF